MSSSLRGSLMGQWQQCWHCYCSTRTEAAAVLEQEEKRGAVILPHHLSDTINGCEILAHVWLLSHLTEIYCRGVIMWYTQPVTVAMYLGERIVVSVTLHLISICFVNGAAVNNTTINQLLTGDHQPHSKYSAPVSDHWHPDHAPEGVHHCHSNLLLHLTDHTVCVLLFDTLTSESPFESCMIKRQYANE